MASKKVDVRDLVFVREGSKNYHTLIHREDTHSVLEINDNQALISDGINERDDKYFPLEDLIVVRAKNGSSQYICSGCRRVFVYPDEKTKNGSNVCDRDHVDVCPFCGHEFFQEK